jgi:phosphoglycolate phosphatase-like HAD superfamily hydrolase
MHVCLFDIDGTLISSGGAGKSAMLNAMKTAFGLEKLVGNVPFSGRTDRAIARDLFQMHAIAETPINWHAFMTSYLHHLPTCLASHTGQILPGIAALLQELRARDDLAIGLLTGNLREGARIKLSHYGLYDYFLFGGFGDRHFCRNEVAREALAAVQDHLRQEAGLDRLWVIGDTPLDIECARAIGARVVAVATGLHPADELAAEEPDLLVNDFSDPAPFLSMLM